MARKNNMKSEHSGSILFDTRTRAVMAGPDSNDNIKEKVQCVREVVPGKSNNEMVLVLQYYDYNVEKAIQAYFEDGAKEALGQWHVPPAKPNKKRKNKKKAATSQAEDSSADAGVATSSGQSSTQAAPVPANGIGNSNGNGSFSSKSPVLNGDIIAGSINSLEVTSSAYVDGAQSIGATPSSTASVSHSKHHDHRAHTGSHSHGHQGHNHHQRNRTVSERSTASSVGAGGDNHSRRPFHGLEKSIKDLQRQTVSLERLRLVLDHEIDRSFKSIKSVFEEMRTHLNQREKEMLLEMDVVKQQANDVFKMRQEKAATLKVHIERAEKLSEAELGELRADVKTFASDRKVDEELGKTIRFQYDSDHLKEEILHFGEVIPVKCCYSVRRPSVSSVASSGVGVDDVHPAILSPVDTHAYPLHSSLQDQDSSQMTTEELASLQMRLQNSLKLQGLGTGDHRPASGTSTSVNDDSGKSKSSRRRNRNRERQEAGGATGGGESAAMGSAPEDSGSTSRANTPSSTHASAGSSPSPQRGQHSPRRSGGYRGRGRGGQQGAGVNQGGQNQGSRGSPRRPYSGGRGAGRGGGGSSGGGADHNRQNGRAVVVNGSSS